MISYHSEATPHGFQSVNLFASHPARHFKLSGLDWVGLELGLSTYFVGLIITNKFLCNMGGDHVHTNAKVEDF